MNSEEREREREKKKNLFGSSVFDTEDRVVEVVSDQHRAVGELLLKKGERERDEEREREKREREERERRK